MIFVDGLPFSPRYSSTSQGKDILLALLENPILVSASNSFKAIPERKFSVSEDSTLERSKWVYIFQREYATVDPAVVEFVGTDEATTCVGLVIRNRRNGMTSVAHMDSPKIVEMGLSQMLSQLVDGLDTEFDVHIIGGFEEVSLQHAKASTESEAQAEFGDHSFPLCTKIVQTLWAREEKFHIRTICVLGHNTRRDSNGNAYPLFNGFVLLVYSKHEVPVCFMSSAGENVETTSGNIIPASFHTSTRCPDEIVRRIRVSASYEDTSWNGKLIETYDTATDQFQIAPCRWTHRQYYAALSLLHYTDSEILSICSTSPTAEGSDFVDNLKRQWNYLIAHPYWTDTFPEKQPRVFKRTTDGRWRRC
ncbi:protein N-terminal asparagine amidohydrolase isoform X1 [Arachis duranensis]|uniref:Protein N-terminal asparagine amidohydrolase isoform X1 n=1 Tax=Arachis duranensis TaxID=130453 RepID=A0A6P4AX87_ARADU|nr:protein N-terminal asparagine amidohydrolase isoform X1 [Arachis duranensis]XP_025610015.1 protein N-terminal asparagine amidohydrolase isoform X1 [Arachis hypogaea]